MLLYKFNISAFERLIYDMSDSDLVFKKVVYYLKIFYNNRAGISARTH